MIEAFKSLHKIKVIDVSALEGSDVRVQECTKGRVKEFLLAVLGGRGAGVTLSCRGCLGRALGQTASMS